MRLKYTIEHADSGKKVKQLLKTQLNLSERLIKKIKYAHQIFLNGEPVFVNHPVFTGDLLEACVLIEEESETTQSENIPLDIVFEDDSLIVINKKPNMVVHPTCYHQSGTIANGLVHYFQSNGLRLKIRPVNRLDRDTSGLILFAKNPYVQETLIKQMQAKTFYKEYIGIVHGTFSNNKGTINLPIERKPDSIILRHVTDSGAPSVTHYEVLENLKDAALLKFNLETGRTHQIRVHCQATGHPLLGDSLYTSLDETASCHNPPGLMSRQALHSFKVSFMHPSLSQKMCLTAPIPQDIQIALEILRN